MEYQLVRHFRPALLDRLPLGRPPMAVLFFLLGPYLLCCSEEGTVV